MMPQDTVDESCICFKKYETNPFELVICPLHPCICLEAQNIDCPHCTSQLDCPSEKCDEEVQELEEEEEEVNEPSQADSAVDLNCYEDFEDSEDFEAPVTDPPQEIIIDNFKYCLVGRVEETADYCLLIWVQDSI